MADIERFNELFAYLADKPELDVTEVMGFDPKVTQFKLVTKEIPAVINGQRDIARTIGFVTNNVLSLKGGGDRSSMELYNFEGHSPMELLALSALRNASDDFDGKSTDEFDGEYVGVASKHDDVLYGHKFTVRDQIPDTSIGLAQESTFMNIEQAVNAHKASLSIMDVPVVTPDEPEPIVNEEVSEEPNVTKIQAKARPPVKRKSRAKPLPSKQALPRATPAKSLAAEKIAHDAEVAKRKKQAAILAKQEAALTEQRRVIDQKKALDKQKHNEHTDTSNEVIDTKLSLDDVGGLEQVKKTLRDIATSFQYPEVMEKWGAKRPQGVLMYGEPGTGKTMLAKALASEIGAKMWVIQSTDIYDMWLGNSEIRIKDIFNRARQYKDRLLIFFDEFDSIVGITEGPDPGGAGSARNGVAGIFKQEMNTLAVDNPNVLVVAATNKLDRIDPALRRSGRFDHTVYIPMPDIEARQQILANIVARLMLQRETKKFKVFQDNLSINELADKTDEMSGADITELFRRIALSRAIQEARTGKQQPPISQEEIEQEIRGFRT